MRSFFGGVAKSFADWATGWSTSVDNFGINSARGSAFDSVWGIGGIEVTAQCLASLPIKFVNEYNEVIDRPDPEQQQWIDLFRKPDPAICASQLWELTSMLYDIDGICYWILLDDSGRPIDNPLTPPTVIKAYGIRNVSPVYEARGDRVISWHLQVNGLLINLQSWQVLRFWKTNPMSYRNGLAFADKVGDTLALERDIKATNKGFFRNGARPSGVLKATKKWERTELESYGRNFKANYSGAGTSGSIPITPDGLEFVPFEKAKDMDFRELHAFDRDELFGAHRAPKHYLGVNDNINRATAEVLDSVFWLNTIRPRTVVFADLINERMLMGTGMKLVFDFDVIPVIKIQALEVLERKLKVAARYWRLGYGLNEIARLLDLGMDQIPAKWANEAHNPAELATGAQPDAGNAESATKGLTLPFDDMRASLKRSLARIEKTDLDLARDGDEEASERVIKAIEDKTVLPFLPKMQKIIESYFKRLEKSQLERFNAFMDGKYFYDKSVNVDPNEQDLAEDDIPKILFNEEKWNGILITDTAPTLLNVYNASKDLVKQELGGFLNFVQSDAQASQASAKLTNKIVRINETVRKDITEKIVNVISEGGSRADMVNAIQDTFEASVNRAVTIARTETGIAASGARWDAMSAELQNKQWISAKDEGVRTTHKEHARKGSVPIDYSFAPGLKHPHDPGGSAAEVINCRCTLVKGK